MYPEGSHEFEIVTKSRISTLCWILGWESTCVVFRFSVFAAISTEVLSTDSAYQYLGGRVC